MLIDLADEPLIVYRFSLVLVFPGRRRPRNIKSPPETSTIAVIAELASISGTPGVPPEANVAIPAKRINVVSVFMICLCLSAISYAADETPGARR